MKVTKENYFDVVKKQGGIDNLPQRFRKGNSVAVGASTNNWKFYRESDTIRTKLDKYFADLGEYLSEQQPATTVAHKTTPAPKPAPVPTPKEPKREVSYVEHFNDDLRMLRRFHNFVGREKTMKQLLRLHKDFQKAITGKQIRSSSNFAALLRQTAKKIESLCDAVSRLRAKKIIVELEDRAYEKRLQDAVYGNEIYKSVQLVRQGINMEGEEPDERRVKSLQKQITNAIESGRIAKRDPYYSEVSDLRARLNLFLKSRLKKFALHVHELKGLNGQDFSKIAKDAIKTFLSWKDKKVSRGQLDKFAESLQQLCSDPKRINELGETSEALWLILEHVVPLLWSSGTHFIMDFDDDVVDELRKSIGEKGLRGASTTQHVGEKFIRTFLKWNNKTITRAEVNKLMAMLNQALPNRNSEIALSQMREPIRFIVKLFIDFQRSGADTLKFALDRESERELREYLQQQLNGLGCADCHKNSSGENLIRSFLSWDGKTVDRMQLGLFYLKISRYIHSNHLIGTKPMTREMNILLDCLEPMMKLKADKFKVTISKNTRKALEDGLSSQLSGIPDDEQDDEQDEAINSTLIPAPEERPRSLTAKEQIAKNYRLLAFDGKWACMGNPGKNFTMMIHGEPGSGKTSFLLKFAEYLSKTFGKVLYVSSEEFDTPTMQLKMAQYVDPNNENLVTVDDYRGHDLREYDFVILDSVNDMEITPREFEEAIFAANPNAAYILVFQVRKDARYKGGSSWQHDVDYKAETKGGKLIFTKNRYGAKPEIDVFNDV